MIFNRVTNEYIVRSDQTRHPPSFPPPSLWKASRDYSQQEHKQLAMPLHKLNRRRWQPAWRILDVWRCPLSTLSDVDVAGAAVVWRVEFNWNTRRRWGWLAFDVTIAVARPRSCCCINSCSSPPLSPAQHYTTHSHTRTRTCAFGLRFLWTHTKDTAAHAAASLKTTRGLNIIKVFQRAATGRCTLFKSKVHCCLCFFLCSFLIYLKVVWAKEKKKILYLQNFVECSLMNFCRAAVLNRLGKQIMRGNCLVMETLLSNQRIIIFSIFKSAAQTRNKIVFRN